VFRSRAHHTTWRLWLERSTVDECRGWCFRRVLWVVVAGGGPTRLRHGLRWRVGGEGRREEEKEEEEKRREEKVEL
jgi:hypothetical protein